MLEALKKLRDAGILDELDAAFGEWLARWGGEPVALAGALVSAEVARGHVCLELETVEQTLRQHDITPPKNWRNTLAKNEVVAQPGGRAPLVQEGGQLYLHRYWRYETRIAATLRELAAPAAPPDANSLKAALGTLFPAIEHGAQPSPLDARASNGEPEGDSGREPDRQALAAAIGATRRLAIISGGPGTGKTTTVIKLIRLVRVLSPDIAIALAAPTGKAASRLSETLANGGLSETETFDATPQTLHRLLGYNPVTQRLRHDAVHPLPADLIVVDEASMVDIGLMARLVAALKPDARLVLVGDRDQLASVEAGAVFGDICSVAEGFSTEATRQLTSILGAALPKARGNPSPISDSIALLKRNYRFRAGGDMGELARAVIAGNSAQALELLTPSPLRGETPPPSSSPPAAKAPPSSPPIPAGKAPPSSPSPLAGEGRDGGYNREAIEGQGMHPHPNPLPSRERGGRKQTLPSRKKEKRRDISSSENETWRTVANEKQLARELQRINKKHFAPMQNAASPEEALKRLNRFRLLAAERRGPFGVEGLNARVEFLLGVRPNDNWYRGRPILITENDYELELFNGDFGIVWPDDEGHDKLWLTGADGTLKSMSLARLPAHETAWALTVHKAQGSEFDRVALVLPPRESAVATRELLYTGLTRARQAVEVWATEPAFRAAVERRIRRASGLAHRLRD